MGRRAVGKSRLADVHGWVRRRPPRTAWLVLGRGEEVHQTPRGSCQEKAQSFVRFRQSDLEHLCADNTVLNERVELDSALKVGERLAMGYNRTAEIGLETADKKKHAVPDTLIDPGFVRLHEGTRPVSVRRESQ